MLAVYHNLLMKPFRPLPRTSQLMGGIVRWKDLHFLSHLLRNAGMVQSMLNLLKTQCQEKLWVTQPWGQAASSQIINKVNMASSGVCSAFTSGQEYLLNEPYGWLELELWPELEAEGARELQHQGGNLGFLWDSHCTRHVGPQRHISHQGWGGGCDSNPKVVHRYPRTGKLIPLQ